MPPERFNALLTRSFRDPKSPADAPTLNHIGQEILKVANGESPTLTKSSAGLGDTGVDSVNIDSATDLPEKSAPHKPKIEGKIVTPSDDPKFHVKEGYRTNADGTTEVLTPKFNQDTGKLEKRDRRFCFSGQANCCCCCYGSKGWYSKADFRCCCKRELQSLSSKVTTKT